MIKFEMGKLYYFKAAEEHETVICHLGDKTFMSDSRWVSE